MRKDLKVGDWIDSTDYWEYRTPDLFKNEGEVNRYIYKVIEIKRKVYLTLKCYKVYNKKEPWNLKIVKYKIEYFDDDSFKIIDESEAFEWFL